VSLTGYHEANYLDTVINCPVGNYLQHSKSKVSVAAKLSASEDLVRILDDVELVKTNEYFTIVRSAAKKSNRRPIMQISKQPLQNVRRVVSVQTAKCDNITYRVMWKYRPT